MISLGGHTIHLTCVLQGKIVTDVRYRDEFLIRPVEGERSVSPDPGKGTDYAVQPVFVIGVNRCVSHSGESKRRPMEKADYALVDFHMRILNLAISPHDFSRVNISELKIPMPQNILDERRTFGESSFANPTPLAHADTSNRRNITRPLKICRVEGLMIVKSVEDRSPHIGVVVKRQKTTAQGSFSSLDHSSNLRVSVPIALITNVDALSPKEFPLLRSKTIQRLRFQHTGPSSSLTALSGVKKPTSPKHINPTETEPIRDNISYSLANSSLRHYRDFNTGGIASFCLSVRDICSCTSAPNGLVYWDGHSRPWPSWLLRH
ncbi:hypothetical protein TNCV_479381 [Trichonephila clavipes]|nr:hypothetical protein TNCV_479381 [Trichonephila clavipes]